MPSCLPAVFYAYSTRDFEVLWNACGLSKPDLLFVASFLQGLSGGHWQTLALSAPQSAGIDVDVTRVFGMRYSKESDGRFGVRLGPSREIFRAHDAFCVGRAVRFAKVTRLVISGVRLFDEGAIRL